MTGDDAAAARLATRLEEMNGRGCWEWQVAQWDAERETLWLVGGGDMDHGHTDEAHFEGVTYVACPTRMRHPRFRIASHIEAIASGAVVAQAPGAFVVLVDCDTDNRHDHTACFCARSVRVERAPARGR
jgi:hypothetical protein